MTRLKSASTCGLVSVQVRMPSVYGTIAVSGVPRQQRPSLINRKKLAVGESVRRDRWCVEEVCGVQSAECEVQSAVCSLHFAVVYVSNQWWPCRAEVSERAIAAAPRKEARSPD